MESYNITVQFTVKLLDIIFRGRSGGVSVYFSFVLVTSANLEASEER